MKKLILLVGMLALASCATLGKREFKESAAYNRDFDTVWKVCLDALSNQTIDHADKNLHQIVTKPVKEMALMGAGDALERTVTIKISESKPYKVSVLVSTAKTTTTTAVGGIRGLSSTDTYSDVSEEKRLLELIDSHLR
jgi:hypothetical protein